MKILIYFGIHNMFNFSQIGPYHYMCFGFDANPDKVEHAISKLPPTLSVALSGKSFCSHNSPTTLARLMCGAFAPTPHP